MIPVGGGMSDRGRPSEGEGRTDPTVLRWTGGKLPSPSSIFRRLGACPGHAHQKCPEDDAGVSPAGDRADQVCRNHEASEVDSQRDCGNGEAVKGQKDIPDGASGCVVGHHDDCKRVTAGEVKGNCIL
jgi:hypothetical protein